MAMVQARIALLADRGVVGVTGADARSFLDNLITNDMSRLDQPGAALHAGLLSPQGKILFEFFVVQTGAGFLLETGLAQAAALAKRLAMYKLRAKVEIRDVAGEVVVAALQGDVRARPGGVISFVDPRDERLGDRLLIPAPLVGEALAQSGAARMTIDAYDAHRIGLGVPSPGVDYQLGDAFPHEANFDQLHGVSFTKGCFIGQEVVARMQNKSVVRKRVVRVSGAAVLTSGSEITAGAASIGSIGSVAGREGLAMLRLDRVVEAIDKGDAIVSRCVVINVEAAAVASYREAVANRPIINL